MAAQVDFVASRTSVDVSGKRQAGIAQKPKSSLKLTQLQSVLGRSQRPRTILSSIGGFSQPTNKRIHTLEDLLRYVQSLGLTTFDSSQIERTALLGQGVSYRVFGGTDRQSGSVIAVKRVKLPPSSTNYEAFEHRVTCVLRDIEVMHHGPLAQHTNIIKLLGYGWDYEQRDTIPYLVTELAEEGTLRQYLSRHKMNVRQGLELCGDVISGLYEIHLCGICHGDVKLDNILVSSFDFQHATRYGRPVAKISDFGHSLMLASEQASVNQYRGTVGYAPPETYLPDEKNLAVDIRKCDLWALGLACWEMLANGIPYYESTIVQQALLTTISATTSLELSGPTLRSDGTSTETKSRQLYVISGQMSSLVEKFLEADASSIYDQLTPDQLMLCKSFFRALLEPDPMTRSALVIHLPLFYGTSSIPKATFPREQLIPKNATERRWVFETFKPSQMAVTPDSAKKRIFQDFQLMINHRDPLQAARANLHIGFAYGTGFGVAQSLQACRNIVNKCASEKLQIALPLAKMFRESKSLLNEENSVKCYNFFTREFLKEQIPIPKLESINGNSTYVELENTARKAAQGLGSFVTSTPTFAVYCKMTHEIPYGAPLNERLPASGETALAVACRLGDYQATIDLLDRGADPSISDRNGCLPLHWLFMFDDLHIEHVASRLTQDWGLQHINSKSSTPMIPDLQYPLVLHGTALAFATTSCSTTAVKTLLGLGADAACGFDEVDPDWGDRSAITLAVCLHLVDIFGLLWPTLPHNLPLNCLHPGVAMLACTLPKCSIIERYLIHGENYRSVRQQMASLLRAFKPFHERFNNDDYAPIEAAVDVMDLEAAETVLKVYFNSKQGAKNQLFLFCINIACRGTLDWQECTSLLNFAVSQGGSINATIEDHQDISRRAVDILIHRRQDKLLRDWLLEKRPELTEVIGAHCSLCPLYDMIENGLSLSVPVEALLSRGADPNFKKPEKGHNALHLAIIKNLLSEVKTLLKYQADPLMLDQDGRPAFYIAISCGNVPMVQEILKYIEEVNIADSDGESPLRLASSLGLADVASLLLEHGARSSNHEASREMTALHVAATKGHHGVLKAIVQSGQPLDPRNSDDLTPLHLAIQSRPYTHGEAYACAVSLLEAGADPNAHNEHLSCAVHMVLRHFGGQERLNLIRKLHEHGAGLDVPRSDGTTILHLAAYMGDSALVKYLLEAGVPTTSLGKHGQTPLHDCVRSQHLKAWSRHGPHHQVGLDHVSSVAKMLVEAGSCVPFRPYARNIADGEMPGYEPLPKTVDITKPRSLIARWNELIQEMQERRIQDNKRRQIEMANKIEGYGILLFRDNRSATPLELAVLRKSDREVLACLLKIHQDATQQPKDEQQEEKRTLAVSSISTSENGQIHKKVINAGWTAAINASNWLAVREFLMQKIPVNLKDLCWPNGRGLLEYAIDRSDDQLLHLFTGDTAASIHTPNPLPYQPNWPAFPRLDNEFSFDLSCLWEITSTIRKARVLDDKNDSYYENGVPFHWHKQTALLVNSKTRGKARKKVLQAYQKSGLFKQNAANPLQELWLLVLGMDIQTACFYFGITGKTSELLRNLNFSDYAVRFEADHKDICKHLVELVGLNSLEKWARAWVEGAQIYTCAPGKTSIPFGLIYEVAADPTIDSKRTQRLWDIINDYRDLVVMLEDEGFMAHVITFESRSDHDWFLTARSALRTVWTWLDKLYVIELDKWSVPRGAVAIQNDLIPSIIVTQHDGVSGDHGILQPTSEDATEAIQFHHQLPYLNGEPVKAEIVDPGPPQKPKDLRIEGEGFGGLDHQVIPLLEMAQPVESDIKAEVANSSVAV